MTLDRYGWPSADTVLAQERRQHAETKSRLALTRKALQKMVDSCPCAEHKEDKCITCQEHMKVLEATQCQ